MLFLLRYFINKIINNHKNKNEINFNSSNISNIPPKSLIYIKNIDVYKFNGLNQLNTILNEFIDISNNSQNPLYFDINTYMHKPQDIYTQYNYNKYIRINDRFFTYYNKIILKGVLDGVYIKFYYLFLWLR